MFVPKKLHPFVNEYHSTSCDLSTIIFAIELVEGKDEPPKKEIPTFLERGKAASLLLFLCDSIFSIRRVVILDRGFYVLQELVKLRNMDVFTAAVVKKKRRY